MLARQLGQRLPARVTAGLAMVEESTGMNVTTSNDTAALEAMIAPAFSIIGTGSAADAPVGERGEWLSNAARYPWPSHDVRLVKVHDLGDTAAGVWLPGSEPTRRLGT